MSIRTIVAPLMLGIGLAHAAHAADTVLKFVGPCENSTCSAAGPNGTPQATATASITLSDLTWVATSNGFEAQVSDIKDLNFQGAHAFLKAGTGTGINAQKSYLFSTTGLVEDISDFLIVWTVPTSIGVQDGGFLGGDDGGWGFGNYFPLSVGGFTFPTPMNIESSTIPGRWSVSAVPEPNTSALLLAGLGLMGLMVRKRGTAR